LTAEDWPHWLGPNANNRVAPTDGFDPNLNNWKIAWQAEVGLGYSTVTTSDGRAYTMGHDGDSKETVLCFKASNGEKIWEYSYDGALLPKMHAGGPNASVTISENYAYTVGKEGQVFCLNARSGKRIWSANLTELLNMKVPNWGFGSSPVEYESDILITAGRTIALDKETGKTSWISNEERKAGYGSPIVFSRGSDDYIATMDTSGLSILNANNGKEIARYDQRVKFGVNATTPVIIDDGESIFFYTNSNSEVLSFDGKSLRSQWGDRKLQNALSGSVLIEGALYGIDGMHKTRKASLFSRDASTGEVYWTVPKYGFASLIAVGDTLLILTEAGELVTAPASPKRYTEISRRKLLDPICWTNPTYANGRIFIRNEQGTLIVLEEA